MKTMTGCMALVAAWLLAAPSLVSAQEPGGPPMEGFESTYGETITVEGRLDMDRVASGKRFQGTWLVLEDGSRYVLSYRPMPEHFALLERRVLVTGRPYTPGVMTQHISARHFEVESIALAEGESPIQPAPTEVPAPSRVESAEGLAERVGMWVELHGALGASFEKESVFITGTLTLADGTSVQVEGAASHWEPLGGGPVTVTAKLSRDDEGGYALNFSNAVCEGDVPACGVRQAAPKKKSRMKSVPPIQKKKAPPMKKKR